MATPAQVASSMNAVLTRYPDTGDYLRGGMASVVRRVQRAGHRRRGLLINFGLAPVDLFRVFTALDTLLPLAIDDGTRNTVEEWLFGRDTAYYTMYARVGAPGAFDVPPPSAFATAHRYKDADGRQYNWVSDAWRSPDTDALVMAAHVPGHLRARSVRAGLPALGLPKAGDKVTLTLNTRMYTGPTPPGTGEVVVETVAAVPLVGRADVSVVRAIIQINAPGTWL